MEQKILFIADKGSLAEKYSQIIESEYELERRFLNAKSLYRELYNVSAILIYTSKLEAAHYDLIYTFLTVMPETFIPVILFGSSVDRKSFRSGVNYPVQLELDNSNERLKLCREINNFLKQYLPEAPPEPEPEPVIKKKIFVVDEDISNLQHIKKLLSAEYETSVLNSTTALFHLFKQKLPDLLILRYHSEKHEAFIKIMERLKKQDDLKEIPVMLMGNQIQSAALNQLLTYKIKGFIADTTSDSELLAMIAAKL